MIRRAAMKPIFMVLGFLWLSACPASIPAVQAQTSHETIEGDAVPAIIKKLHEAVPTLDDECDGATKIHIHPRGEQTHVLLDVEATKTVCVVTGPTDGVRRLLLDVQGQPV